MHSGRTENFSLRGDFTVNKVQPPKKFDFLSFFFLQKYRGSSWLGFDGCAKWPRLELTSEKVRVDHIPSKARQLGQVSYGGYMILLTCGILGIFRYKKSEVNIQMKTEAWVSSNSNKVDVLICDVPFLSKKSTKRPPAAPILRFQQIFVITSATMKTPVERRSPFHAAKMPP